ncbi:MAG: acyl-CoA dehydrogenase [Lachnospiraceae bacterium]|jgi:alkylation response protein AidB-like acyl-CoA dehydrogenase|nr:acyl-CoA dehydrogenase [Lachnospiraceae bacterium]
MATIYTEDQISVQELIGDFMKKKVKPYLRELDDRGEFPQDIYKEAFKLGLHCLQIPEEFGGAGLDYVTMAVALEEMGKCDPGFAITMLSTSMTLKCILLGGNKEQKQRAADILIPGAHGCFSMTEPLAGSDALGLRTTACEDGDDYILNGTKCFATNGGYSDLYVIIATVDKSLGSKGTVAFMVEGDTPGLNVGKHENKMGLRLSNTCDLYLENVRVPKTNMLGSVGDGIRIALAGLDTGRIYNAAIAVGIAQNAIEESVAYAKTREQFGKPIFENQALKMMLADMQIGTEAGRQLVFNAMRLLDGGVKKVSMEASCAKTFCSDNAVKVTTDAVQILGGYGYSKEYPVEKMMRDSKIFQIFEGTNQIQRLVIAKEMAKLY